MNLVNDARIDLVQKALDGLSQREQAIASNIANVDTPGYQRRDVDFESSLRASMNQQSGGMTSAIPSLLQSGGAQSSPSGTMRNDGNNVDIDSEMSELAETQLRYQLLTQVAASRFSILQSVVKS